MKSRRDFLRAFAVGSVGMMAAEKAGFFEELWKWWNSPAKTIFIPPARELITYAAFDPGFPVGWEHANIFMMCSVLGISPEVLGKEAGSTKTATAIMHETQYWQHPNGSWMTIEPGTR